MSLFGNKNNNRHEPDNTLPPEEEKVQPAEPVTEIPAEAKEPVHAQEETVHNPIPFSPLPEKCDFAKYFLPNQRIILDNISYETQRATPGQLLLTPKDTIIAQVMGSSGVKLTFNRSVRFEPEGPFTLSVTFGVMLMFNPATSKEIDWHHTDLAGEFKKRWPALINALASKTILMVAEITNASGLSPIIIR